MCKSASVKLGRKEILQSIIAIFTSLIISEGCLSLTDALRDVDTKGLVRNDSMLIRDNISTSINLEDLSNTHHAKVEKNKDIAMIMVLRDVGSTNTTMLSEDACLLTPNGCNNKVLFYKKLGKEGEKVKLELEWFLQHDQTEISNNLLDTHINLCPSSVLSLFSDKFDSQTMGDFIKGVLNNEEILDSRIYREQLNSKEYAVPVTSWQTYCMLRPEISQRYSLPFVPDTLPLFRNSKSTRRYRRAFSVDSSSIVSPDSKIGNNVEILSSVVAGHVVIKDNCLIVASVISFYAVLERNVKIYNCIVNNNAHVREGHTCRNSVVT